MIHKVSLEQLKDKIEEHYASNRFFTIKTDGELVVDKEPIDIELFEQIVNRDRPNLLLVTFWKTNGSHAPSRPKYQIAGMYEVNMSEGSMNGIDSAIEDAKIIEEPSAAPAPPGPMTSQPVPGQLGMDAGTANFAYQMTLQQLNEAKADLKEVKGKLDKAEKDLIEKDRTILQHEHKASEMEKDLEKSSSWGERMAGFGAIAASDEGLKAMLGSLIGSLGSALASQGKASLPEANSIQAWVENQTPEVQKEFGMMMQKTIEAFMAGNKEIFKKVINDTGVFQQNTRSNNESDRKGRSIFHFAESN